MFQVDYFFCLNLLLSVNDKSYVNVVPLTYVILTSLLSFDMSNCILAAMDGGGMNVDLEGIWKEAVCDLT
jgi:hypothetical protein